MTANNPWDAALARIETKVNRHSFYTWFKPTGFAGVVGNSIQVRVPDSMFREWLLKHYSAVITEALAEVQPEGLTVEFVTDPGGPESPEPTAGATTADSVNFAVPVGPGLNPRYTFDTFVVGSSNQFARSRVPRRRGSSIPLLQPAVHLRRRRSRQDAL